MELTIEITLRRPTCDPDEAPEVLDDWDCLPLVIDYDGESVCHVASHTLGDEDTPAFALSPAEISAVEDDLEDVARNAYLSAIEDDFAEPSTLLG